MTIIDRYLRQEIVTHILVIMLALMSMFSFFDLLQELDNIGRGAYGVGTAMLFVLLSAPGHVYEVVPVAVLIGTLYALAQLARHSELVVLRVSGVSMATLGLILLRVGVIFAVLTFLVGELITPLSEKAAQRMRIQATDSVVAQDFRSGLWMKDGNSFVNIEDVLPGAELINIHIYEFDASFHLRHISNARSGTFKGGHWKLQDVTQTSFVGNKVQSELFAQGSWQSQIQPDLLNVLLVVPEKMSAWNLYFYIHHLSENHQKTTRHEIALWSKMVYPIACLVMVVLALPFAFLQQRAGGISAKLFAGIMLGISYQVLNRLFIHIGLLSDWPAPMSAIVPTLLYLSVALGMLVWTERR